MSVPDPISQRFLHYSAEYSAELQLQVLGVRPEELLEPILDLGCGAQAALVRQLRACGRDAYGLDRAATPDEFVDRADWFDGPLGRSRWGTVISHMALSNHFLHHHLRPDGQAERYARRYMDILRALQPGGAFLYAPGLPFLESLLPEEVYAVAGRPVQDLVGGAVDQELRDAFGTSVLYACRVTRLSR